MAACPRCPLEAGVDVDASSRTQQTRTNLAASDNSNRAAERQHCSFLVNSTPFLLSGPDRPQAIMTLTVKALLTMRGCGASVRHSGALASWRGVPGISRFRVSLQPPARRADRWRRPGTDSSDFINTFLSLNDVTEG